MLKENIDIRLIARQKLQGKWVSSSLAYFLINLVIGLITGIFLIPYFILIFQQSFENAANAANVTVQPMGFEPTPQIIITYFIGIFASFFVSGIAYYGIRDYFLKLSNGNNLDIGDIFIGFKSIGRSLRAGIITNLFVFLWSLLFVVPGMIKFLSYRMTWYILAENPDMTVMEAISKSKEMMSGNKGNLFALYLSYIGWYLLVLLITVVTCGVGMISAFPFSAYIETAVAEFYKDLKENSKATTL